MGSCVRVHDATPSSNSRCPFLIVSSLLFASYFAQTSFIDFGLIHGLCPLLSKMAAVVNSHRHSGRSRAVGDVGHCQTSTTARLGVPARTGV